MNEDNATRIRRQLLVKLVRTFLDGTLANRVDRFPLEMIPKSQRGERLRCCVHTERAILRYRLMVLLGFPTEDETDELKPLAQYAEGALTRRRRDHRFLTVIDDACSACVKGKYFVTNACRGCMAQPCMLNCPKKAITMVDGRSRVDGEKCVNCGRCQDLCPFHAILRVPVPCEEACPVSAITRAETGKQIIDHGLCIQCGKCLQACPFGAVAEPSEIIDVLGALTGPMQTVALFAPALLGQFDASLEKTVGALLALGFDHVMEVAAGADLTTRAEAAELVERLDEGAAFMTTSCCPAYTSLVDKHLTGLRPFVSHTPSPMHFVAQEAAAAFPGALRVFIGPCVAKRREALGDPLVDYVLTFEELGAAFVAKGIDVGECAGASPEAVGSGSGRGYPVSSGVRDAVTRHIAGKVEVRSDLISGLNKEALRRLKAYAAGKGPGNFVECMSCEGGCINGPGVLADPKLAKRRIEAIVKASGEPPVA